MTPATHYPDRYKEHSRRRAVVRLYPHQVAAMLDLPPGMTVVAMTVQPDPFHISVLLESHEFPEVGPDVEPIVVRPVLEEVVVRSNRWDWSNVSRTIK